MARYPILLLLLTLPVAQPRAGIVEGERAFLAGDYEFAASELLPLVAGNVLAAYYLGVMNLDTQWTKRNAELGTQWLTIAAHRGHTGAQRRLALAYEHGDVVERDYRVAAQWMLEAARGGNADAQYYVGRYYRNGQGVIQDDAQAVEWIHRSVEYDISHDRLLDALLYLGAAYEWGRGRAQNLTEAYKWFSLASSYSTDDATMRDEAALALDALRIRMSPTQLAEAGERAEAWRMEKEQMYGSYYAGSAARSLPWRSSP